MLNYETNPALQVWTASQIGNKLCEQHRISTICSVTHCPCGSLFSSSNISKKICLIKDIGLNSKVSAWTAQQVEFKKIQKNSHSSITKETLKQIKYKRDKRKKEIKAMLFTTPHNQSYTIKQIVAAARDKRTAVSPGLSHFYSNRQQQSSICKQKIPQNFTMGILQEDNTTFLCFSHNKTHTELNSKNPKQTKIPRVLIKSWSQWLWKTSELLSIGINNSVLIIFTHFVNSVHKK